MCRPYAHSLTPLPAGPSQGQPAPLLPTLGAEHQLSSPQLRLRGPAKLGQKAGTKPYGFHTNHLPGKEQPCFYF